MTIEPEALGDAFFRFYEGLPRQGPGSEATTREVLRRLPGLPRSAGDRHRVLDLGCGTGESSLVLASELEAEVEAVDLHGPFVETLQTRAAQAGLQSRLHARVGSFLALEDAPGSADLIWSEGAIYLAGFEHGLETWLPLLAEGGVMAVSEACWFTTDPPPDLAAFWEEAYPDMTTVGERIRQAEKLGLLCFDHLLLPTVDWDVFYGAHEARAEALAAEAESDPALARVLEEARREVDLWRGYGGDYGYAFFLLRRMR